MEFLVLVNPPAIPAIDEIRPRLELRLCLRLRLNGELRRRWYRRVVGIRPRLDLLYRRIGRRSNLIPAPARLRIMVCCLIAST